MKAKRDLAMFIHIPIRSPIHNTIRYYNVEILININSSVSVTVAAKSYFCVILTDRNNTKRFRLISNFVE